MTPSLLSGSCATMGASAAAGLHEGCIAAMTAVLAAAHQRPEQGIRWSPLARVPVCQTGARSAGAGRPMAIAIAVRSSSERLWSERPPRTGLA
jgi:hypothetical protein